MKDLDKMDPKTWFKQVSAALKKVVTELRTALSNMK